MGEDTSAILMCLAWFSSHTSCSVSSLETLGVITVLGGSYTRPDRGEGATRGSSLTSGLVPGPQPHPLPVGPCKCTHPSGPGPARQGGSLERAHSLPQETGGTGGQEPWALVPALGLRCPRPTVRG